MTRSIRLALVVALAAAACAAVPAAHAEPCRTLILGAMPVEAGPFLSRASIDATVTGWASDHAVERKTFFVGTLTGRNVVIAMTGIGTVNAIETTRLAFELFSCIDGVVFSGVSGGNDAEHIGDVLVPSHWTLSLFDQDGSIVTSSYAADPGMLAAASTASASVTLSSTGHVGDVACVGMDPETTPAMSFAHTPVITVGSDATPVGGHSSDPFGGHPLPCVPGSDTFGCSPCGHASLDAGDVERTIRGTAPFLTPEFFSWYQSWAGGETGARDVEDMESAAVASVAHGRAPFLAFRSPSDGAQGDPLLEVPGPLGFLPQFLAYRQYAADNAAAVALAFLAEWSG